MRRCIGQIGSIMAVALISCGPPIDKVCDKGGECFLKDCDYSDDVCKALQNGVVDTCNAEYSSMLDALNAGNSDACDRCKEALTNYMDCLADIEACSEFNDASQEAGTCFDEYVDYGNDCEYDRLHRDCYGS
jgi:hypothetical protein